MQHLDADTFVETQLAQAARFGRGELVPGDIGHGRVGALGKLFEAERSRHVATARLAAIDYQ